MIKNRHKSPPKGKPKSRRAYADSANFKFPVDAKHIRAAVSRFNQGNRSGYSGSQWATVGRRIASAARRLIGGAYRFAKGKIVTPNTAKEETLALETALAEVAATMPTVNLLAYFLSDEAAVWDDEDEDPDAGDGDGDGDAATPTPATEEARGLALADVFPCDPQLVRSGIGAGQEEIVVNGEPCFEWESMLIPADAVSKNTVQGKKGPTYYSGRRIREYYQENTKLLEELSAKGQRVTVYPRHMAAMLDATLPTGWVTGYALKPSATRPGLEDLWYRAAAPVNSSDGRDLRTKLRTGLVRFSSLRTFESPAFQTQPVTLNGRVVEEAVRLPIAGVDLVATQPGLPVSPIQILEEAPTLAPLPPEEPHPHPTSDPSDPSDPVVPPSVVVAPPAHHPSPAAAEESTAMTFNCPNCKADLTAAVEDVVSVEKAQREAALEEVGKIRVKLEKFKGERDSLKEQLTEALKKAPGAAGAASEEQQGQVPAAVAAELETLRNKVALFEETGKQVAALQAQLAAQAAKQAVEDKLEGLYNESPNRALADFILPIVEEEIGKLMAAGAVEPSQVEQLWWKTSVAHMHDYVAASRRRPAGFGAVHVAAAASEEQQQPNGTPAPTNARAAAGKPVAAEEDQGAAAGGKYAHLEPQAQAAIASWR